MKAPRLFTPHNTLADRLNDPRGLDAFAAARAADAAVARYEPDGVAEMRRALDMLSSQAAGVKASGPSASFTLARVYAGADVVAGLGALFGRPRLGEAAASLCKLLTEQRGALPDAITVHIEAMLMISKDDRLGEVLLPGLQHLHEAHAPAMAAETRAATRRMALSLPIDP